MSQSKFTLCNVHPSVLPTGVACWLATPANKQLAESYLNATGAHAQQLLASIPPAVQQHLVAIQQAITVKQPKFY